ncbi:nuclear transport factor 2 family protein [Herbiconiux sp. YIM B11900]|uniref:nuclear transport factor 2 family protein n=1 Tax=Herbiconiux sp. YIM B11900 TaxID=3404131 RepID=UPI003F85A259
MSVVGPGPGTGPSPADRHAIAEVIDTGLWALDTRDLEVYLATFWPDASFSEVGPDGALGVWQGIDDIRRMSAARVGGPTGRQHRLSNTLFTPREPAAGASEGRPPGEAWTAWAYWMTSVRHPETGEVRFEMSGYLRDELERRDGEWRLLGRHLDGWPGDLRHPLRTVGTAAG